MALTVIDGIIFAKARPYYDDLPYHNFSHAQEVCEHIETLVLRCERYGIPVNRRVVQPAGAFHDADYAKDHRARGYATKEALAAAIADHEVVILVEDPFERREISGCILATNPEVVPVRIEEKVVRAADLVALAGEYGQLCRNNRLLKEEAELLSGRKISMEDWTRSTRMVLEFYLGQDIRLTPEHDGPQGESVFHARTRRNLQRYLREQ